MTWLPGRTRFGLYKATISEDVYKEYRNKRQNLLYIYISLYTASLMMAVYWMKHVGGPSYMTNDYY